MVSWEVIRSADGEGWVVRWVDMHEDPGWKYIRSWSERDMGLAITVFPDIEVATSEALASARNNYSIQGEVGEVTIYPGRMDEIRTIQVPELGVSNEEPSTVRSNPVRFRVGSVGMEGNAELARWETVAVTSAGLVR